MAGPLDAFAAGYGRRPLMACLPSITHQHAKPCGLWRSIPTMILLLFVFVEIFSVNVYRE